MAYKSFHVGWYGSGWKSRFTPDWITTPNESPSLNIALTLLGCHLWANHKQILSSSTAAAERENGWTIDKIAHEIVATAVSATALSAGMPAPSISGPSTLTCSCTDQLRLLY